MLKISYNYEADQAHASISGSERAAATRVFEAAIEKNRCIYLGLESFGILKAYGIPVVDMRIMLKWSVVAFFVFS